MRLRKRRTGKMVSIDEDVETEEGSVPRSCRLGARSRAELHPGGVGRYSGEDHSWPTAGFRVVFALRDVEGLSTEETAETMGFSIPAVKSRLLRARLQLRERLTRYFKRQSGRVPPRPVDEGVEK